MLLQSIALMPLGELAEYSAENTVPRMMKPYSR